MKRSFKKIIAAVSAASVIALSGINASAASYDDVINAAYAAGISGEYVQTLAGFLKSHDFTPEQYDMMMSSIANIESMGDDIIKQYTGLTLDELRGGSGSNNGSSSEDNTENNNKIDDKWVNVIKDNMTSDQMLEAINEMVDAGKKMGYDVTVDKKGDKNFMVTVKDKDGNIQLIAPVGNVVDRTGVSNEGLSMNIKEIEKSGIQMASIKNPANQASVSDKSDSSASSAAFWVKSSIAVCGILIIALKKRKNLKAGE